jgi:hypothetical protein
VAPTVFKSRRFWLLTIYITGVIAIIVARILRSQHFWQGQEANLVLGSLPNFLAAACIPPLIMSWRKQYVGFMSGLIGAALALALIICWEFFQLSRSEMSFDTNDIAATVLGIFVWLLAWLALDKSLPVA